MSDIDEIGSTAFVIAAIRANEPNQAVRLFDDPYARWFASEPAVAATKALDGAFPPATTMVRFRTRFFNDYVEGGIESGARQVVLLGGGFDMRAHILADERVRFFEVDQAPVVDFKRSVLGAHGLEQPPSVPRNYLEVDLPDELAGVGLELDAPTLVVWEGNTMYLPVGEVMPFLDLLASALPRMSIAFDYMAADLQNRDLLEEADLRRLEGVEAAMRASFPTGFPDLSVFEEHTPLRVAESGHFFRLGHRYGLGDMVDDYPEDWRETLRLYGYCVLAST